MTTPADIVNRALQYVGGLNNIGPVTGSPPTFDGTPQGTAAGLLYNDIVQTIARQFGWDFARNVVTLALTGNTPPMGFTYEYAYPASGIQIRQLLPPTISDANDPRPVQWNVGNALGASTAASGFIQFPANPSPGDTITLNGVVFTFVVSGATPTNQQCNIGGNLGGTLSLLVNLLPPFGYTGIGSLTVATYANANPFLTVTYKMLGTPGNSYTLAASAATPSGGTLTGGSNAQQRVIWTNLQNAIATITNQPPESAWDSIFTEAVVRMLGSSLNYALAGHPESAEATLKQAGAFLQSGEMRTDT